MDFLISEPKSSTCTRLAEGTGISHHSANRFLHRENYQPKDMYDEAVETLSPTGGTLSVDDSVLDKPCSYPVALVGHFWSGKHHTQLRQGASDQVWREQIVVKDRSIQGANCT